MSSIQFERVRWKEIKNKIIEVGLQHYWQLYMMYQIFI